MEKHFNGATEIYNFLKYICSSITKADGILSYEYHQ